MRIVGAARCRRQPAAARYVPYLVLVLAAQRERQRTREMFDLENGSAGAPGQYGVEIALTRVLRLLRPGDVARRTTYSPAHQHRLQQQDRFPRYVRYEGRACGLYEHVLDAWFAVRMRARDEGLAPIGYRPALPQWEFRIEDVPLVCGSPCCGSATLRLWWASSVRRFIGSSPPAAFGAGFAR